MLSEQFAQLVTLHYDIDTASNCCALTTRYCYGIIIFLQVRASALMFVTCKVNLRLSCTDTFFLTYVLRQNSC
jgi:hypothetical protein